MLTISLHHAPLALSTWLGFPSLLPSGCWCVYSKNHPSNHEPFQSHQSRMHAWLEAVYNHKTTLFLPCNEELHPVYRIFLAARSLYMDKSLLRKIVQTRGNLLRKMYEYFSQLFMASLTRNPLTVLKMSQTFYIVFVYFSVVYQEGLLLATKV